MLSGSGYHFAGAATVDYNYTAVYGNLQVADIDLTGAGLSHVLNNFLFTPDYFNYIQTGWIDESYGTNYPRVFVEARASGVDDRWYFDQYNLTPGNQYLFTVVSKPNSWYAMIWWGGTWNQLVSIAATPREGVEQQYLEVYTNGVHPFVPQLLNTDSTLTYQDTLITWDGGVATAPIQTSPYCVTWLNPYYNWLAGSC